MKDLKKQNLTEKLEQIKEKTSNKNLAKSIDDKLKYINKPVKK